MTEGPVTVRQRESYEIMMEILQGRQTFLGNTMGRLDWKMD
jgi:hypothetical protein